MDLSRYVALFTAESESHLEALELELVKWESGALGPDGPYRRLHSLKGMAGSMGHRSLASLAHAAELLLEGVSRPPGPREGDADLLLRAVAHWRRSIALIRANGAPEESAELQHALEEATRALTQRAAPAPEPEANAVEETPAPVGQPGLRVDVGRLEALLDLAGQALIESTRLRDESALEREASGAPRSEREEGLDRLVRLSRELQDVVLAARLTPLTELIGPLQLVAREALRQTGKRAALSFAGFDVGLDRALVDGLASPLGHLLRNAIDHGLESAERRRALSKEPLGTLKLLARREGERIRIELHDDGGGFDLEALARKGAARGLHPADDAARIELAFLPGLSTREVATELSGRGRGLDAVRHAVRKLGGTVSVARTDSRGTVFAVVLPPSLARQRVLMAQAGGQSVGIPLDRVLRVTEAGSALPRGLPVRSLAAWLGWGEGGLNGPFVLMSGARRIAWSVEALLGEHEAVMRPLPRPFDRALGLAGVTLAADGRPLFLLDLPEG